MNHKLYAPLFASLLIGLFVATPTLAEHKFKVHVKGVSGGGSAGSGGVTPGLGASCVFNGVTLASGAAPVIAYSSQTTVGGAACQSESRVCLDGVLSGSYANSACVVGPALASCNAIKLATPSSPSGAYQIDPDGAGPVAPFSVSCDMTSDGGGWTAVAMQYEATPVAWTGGTNGPAFALSSSQIPPHTQTAFGKDGNATFIDYATFNYSTGNIPLTLVAGIRTGVSYYIHRSTSGAYDIYSPDSRGYFSTASNPELADYFDGLTFELNDGQTSSTWSFAPNNALVQARGYSMGGYSNGMSISTFAWSVWVR